MPPHQTDSTVVVFLLVATEYNMLVCLYVEALADQVWYLWYAGEITDGLAAWASSTGPRTSEGKAKASQNAYRGGTRPLLRLLARLLRSQQESLDDWC